jgi:hypothetical protein
MDYIAEQVLSWKLEQLGKQQILRKDPGDLSGT